MVDYRIPELAILAGVIGVAVSIALAASAPAWATVLAVAVILLAYGAPTFLRS